MPKELRFICHLDKILEKKGWTQTDLHNESKVSKTTIRSLIKGGKLERIDRSSTEKLINALKCSFNDLWEVSWEENND